MNSDLYKKGKVVAETLLENISSKKFIPSGTK